MSIFGDYKAYKRFEPTYPAWKTSRDMLEAKRQAYLKQNPNSINFDDIQRSKNLLRAINVMDEYSQKRAEDMEVATDTAVGYGLEGAMLGGGGIGWLVSQIPQVQKFINKNIGKTKDVKTLTTILSVGLSSITGIIAAFPLYAWAAKAEVAASRRGRFEAMRKELNNPNTFAVLTPEQIKEVENIAKNTQIEDNNKKKKNNNNSFSQSIKNLKEMATDSKEYKHQKKIFDLELIESEKHLKDKMTPEEIEKAKKDQQLLTKLVEKIDIASQDYAENAELATQTAITGATGFSLLFSMLTNKLLSAMKIKSAVKISAITNVLSISVPIVLSIISAQIQKEASRVGRFKVKQELMKDPTKLSYVSDENIKNIKDIKIETTEKTSMLNFLKNAWKNQKEFNEYKKNKAQEEDKYFEAMEKIKLNDEQIKDAKTLQRNTFKTFNKIDENSQKYSESIEALGQAVSLPISLLFTGVGAAIGTKLLRQAMMTKGKLNIISGFSKYIGIILLSSIPSIGINAYITKEQKKASKIADMLAINEMSDYRQFR